MTCFYETIVMFLSQNGLKSCCAVPGLCFQDIYVIRKFADWLNWKYAENVINHCHNEMHKWDLFFVSYFSLTFLLFFDLDTLCVFFTSFFTLVCCFFFFFKQPHLIWTFLFVHCLMREAVNSKQRETWTVSRPDKK